jgi:hypothetical protein
MPCSTWLFLTLGVARRGGLEEIIKDVIENRGALGFEGSGDR